MVCKLLRLNPVEKRKDRGSQTNTLCKDHINLSGQYRSLVRRVDTGPTKQLFYNICYFKSVKPPINIPNTDSIFLHTDVDVKVCLVRVTNHTHTHTIKI